MVFLDMANESEKLRIDKYLWAIRIFKTRSLATEACKAGRVKLSGQNVKASYGVKVGDTFTIQKGIAQKVVKVTGLRARRVDANAAVRCHEDSTPVEETSGSDSMCHAPVLQRDRGTGGPTKRDRREIDELQSSDWWDIDDEDDD